MNIITLTTDLGLEDHYVASLKGSILNQCDHVNIVDITHLTQPFNISKAAFHVVNVYRDFPKDTIHVIGVGDEPNFDINRPENNQLPSIMKFNDQYFIAVDNGVFGYILQDEKPQEIWNIDNTLSNALNLKDITKFVLIKAACNLINNIPISSFASPAEKVIRLMRSYSVISANRIIGKVIHTDHYGNSITNVTESEFYNVGKDNDFIIKLGLSGKITIDKISNTFNEVGEADPAALFNLNKRLVIAMNKGANGSGNGADKLFGLSEGASIEINFHPKGSKTDFDNSLF